MPPAATILVTGAAGFIGRFVVAELLKHGLPVCGVDNLSSENALPPPKHPRFRFIRRDLFRLKPSDLPSGIACLVHLAARPSVETSWSDPMGAHDQNLTSLLQVLEWRRKLSIPQVILASSAAVYGRPRILPVREDHPLVPMSPYGLHKKVAEEYLALFAEREGFIATSLRFFNVYGPGQNPKSPYSGVMSIFQDRLATGQEIVLHGTGRQTRDFIHVSDVARAVVLAAGARLKKGHQAFNIGTGLKVTILQLLSQWEKTLGRKAIRVRHLPTRAGDIPHSVAAVACAKRRLGFRARLDLAEGMASFCGSPSAS